MSKNRRDKKLPAVTVVVVTGSTVDGDILFARPENWDEQAKGPAPLITIPIEKQQALGKGDRALVKLKARKNGYEVTRVLKPLGKAREKNSRIVGLVRKQAKGTFVLQPASKKDKQDFDIIANDLNGAKDGDLVRAEISSHNRVRVAEIICHESDPKAMSWLSAYEVGLSTEFSQAALDETKNMVVPALGNREDLRNIPLVTIDGADARDFDDAIYASKTADGGFDIIVAIADVAHYVTSGSALDKDAYKRGNSTYFPDSVLPMLPEALSNELCSLKPNEDRACIAAKMHIDKNGKLGSFKFVRALMRSQARLTYEQVQAARDGQADSITAPLKATVLNPLYETWEILQKARERRGTLELDLPEQRILINDNGDMTGVEKRERLDSHRLIEEFMILANVAAATALERRSAPCIYRVHEEPDPKKLANLRDFINSFDGLSLPKGQHIEPESLNRVLKKAAGTPHSHLISDVILRAQSQARYDADNDGHFGLGLDRYAHFTSPIRRYADLLVHRSLVNELDTNEINTLADKAEHISKTERTSIVAERSATDRFVAAFLATQIGAEFGGRIAGLSNAGVFVRLDDSGADGFIPMSKLPGNNRYDYNEEKHAIIERKGNRIFRLGAPITVKLKEATPLKGGLILEPVGDGGADIPGFKSNTSGKNKRGRHPRP